MKIINLTKTNIPSDRHKVREFIVNLFLAESPGTGTKNLSSRHKYIVKTLSSGKNLFLERPATFNNGFDFTIHVEGINFSQGLVGKSGSAKKATTRPTHDNILTDLQAKKNENNVAYGKLLAQIDSLYRGKTITVENYSFKTGYPCDLILECIKWLFVEQDVTYWHFSGRAMLYNSILAI